MHTYSKIGLAGAVVVALAAAHAANGVPKEASNDAANIQQAKVSLQQAVASAEKAANGRAARAEYEQTQAGWAYDVEVVSGTKVFDVRVDADKGSVISSAEDKADQDDENDQAD